jgi:hypothetical protein
MNEEEEKSREGKDLYRRPQKIQTPALYLSICLLTSKIQIYDKSLPHRKFKYMINHCPTANTPLPPKSKLGNQISCSGNS